MSAFNSVGARKKEKKIENDFDFLFNNIRRSVANFSFNNHQIIFLNDYADALSDLIVQCLNPFLSALLILAYFPIGHNSERIEAM